MIPIYISKRVLEHKYVERVMKTEDIVLIFSGFELKKDFENFEEHFLNINESDLSKIHAKITFIPQMEVGDIYVYIKGIDSFNKIDRTPNYGVNNETFAHNQGKMSPELLTWVKHNTDFLYWVIGIAVLLIMSITISWLIFIPLLVVSYIFWTKWQKINSLFKGGDANPGLVVGLNPTLIAVYTDLTKGYGKFPIIKITTTPLTRINDKNLQIGDKLATIALYTSYANHEIPHWADFSPIPIHLGITNQETINGVMAMFHEEDWVELDNRIKTRTPPYQIGTFKIVNQVNNWEESPINEFLK